MRTALPLLLLLFSTCLFAQTPEEKLAAFASNFPQENVVLQFSKPAYLAGETVAFKAYVLSGYEPSPLSTNLYVELYDGVKNRIDSQIIYLHRGSGDGSFALPASMAEDVYYIRAYTRWMLNFGEEHTYLKPLVVYNPYSTKSLRQKPVQWKAKAFIESYRLLDSAVANVAIRLSGEGSLPKSWSGSLVEEEGNIPVGNVTVYNSEIGDVRFLAFAGKTYKLVLKDDGGNTQEIVLPAASKSGTLLHVTSHASTLRYSILFKNIATGGKGYKLVASYNQQPFYVSSLTRASNGVAGSIDIANLPPGLVQLTLFDEKSQPVSERLCFIHQQQLQPTEPAVLLDTFSVDGRGYNHWQLLTDTASWSSYSIQVSDAAVLPAGDFVSDVYLGADLSLPVHHAEWYLRDVNEHKMAALHALLLIEEKKPVHWPTVLGQTQQPPTFAPEQLLAFSGTVVKGNKPQPLRDMNLLVKATDSSLSFLQVQTNKDGVFVLDNLFFTDSLQVYYQPGRRKFLEGDVSILFRQANRHYPLRQPLPQHGYTLVSRQPTDTLPLLVQRAAAERQQGLLRAEKIKMLEAVVVSTKAASRTDGLDKRLSTGMFQSQRAMLFDFVNDEETAPLVSGNLLQWLQGRVPGLTIAYEDNTPVPFMRNQRVPVYLDEVNVDYETIQSISPADVALIKVIQSGSVIGGGGGIVIYTRRGDMGPSRNTPSLPHYTLTGYKRFTAPTALTASQVQDMSVSDDRIILFRHTLIPPQEGKTAIRFFNNDKAKKFRLSITGFTAEGKPIFLDRILP